MGMDEFTNGIKSFAKNVADKTSEAVKTASDKTSEAIEVGKLNGKIKEEKAKIVDLKAQIGEYFFNKMESGMEVDAAARDFYNQIKTSESIISNIQQQIDSIKAN